MKDIDRIDEELRKKSYFLNERVKEQRCLLGIAKLTSSLDIPLEEVFDQIIAFIIPAWQYPEQTYARIAYRHVDVRSANYVKTPVILVQPFSLRGKEAGFLEVGYLEYPENQDAAPFLDEERKLLEAIAELIESIILKKRQDFLIRRTTRRLKESSQELLRKNLALREILNQIEQEKNETKEEVSLTIRKFILPLIQNLRNENLTDDERRKYVDLVESNITTINSSLTHKLTQRKVNLSPREAEICNLIKNGLQTKEISEMLKLSVLTVERHRFNIRKKLEINNTQVNLQTYLQEA